MTKDAFDDLPHAAAELIIPCCRANPFQESDQEGEIVYNFGAGDVGKVGLARSERNLFEKFNTEDAARGNAPAHKLCNLV